MSTHKFSPAERAAIFSVHGEKCYLCGRPLSLKMMEVDHVIPEALLDKPDELAGALTSLGRSPSFGINTYANWLPACGPCNGAKREIVFEPSPIVQVQLQRAAARAPAAETLAAETVSERKIANALNVLERAHEDGRLDDETIQVLGAFISRNRHPDLTGQPIRLTPLYEILNEQGGIQIVRGPYGIGARPAAPDTHPSFACPSCGSIAAWNGARCVICGGLNDE